MASVYTMLFLMQLSFCLLDYCSDLEETGEEDGTREQMKCCSWKITYSSLSLS